MKKIIALVIASIMLVSVLALVSCRNKDNPNESTNGTTTEATTTTTTTEATTTTEKTETPVTPTYASALDLYNKIWGTYTDDEKFPVAGGDMEHTSMEGPGLFDIEKNKESLKTYIHITDELLATVNNEAANLIHMMNTNTFSSAILSLKDASTAEAFAEDYKKSVQATRWMCGFPDTVIVVSVENYVIVAFGHDDIINTFKAKCLEISGAKLLVEAPAMA